MLQLNADILRIDQSFITSGVVEVRLREWYEPREFQTIIHVIMIGKRTPEPLITTFDHLNLSILRNIGLRL